MNAQTGTAYTLALTDVGKLITLNNASAITLTIPTDATVLFPMGTQIHILQLAAGKITVAGAGVTIGGTPSLITRTTYSMASLIKLNTNFWVVVGDLTIP